MKLPTAAQRRRKRTFIYLYVLLALSILLVAASYTWFGITRYPRVNDMAIHVNTSKGIELATRFDAPDEEWGQEIKFADLVSEDTPLKPVSWSAQQNAFVTANYGRDGRRTDKWDPLSDDENTNRSDGAGYYVKGTVFARSGEPCEVSLMEAVELNQGRDGAGTYVIGTPVWNNQSILHDDGGNGAETAIRIGFRITKVDPLTGAADGESDFYIYEPNCDRHIDGSEGYVDTPSIDGTEALGDRLITQTASDWTEAYPVERNVTIKTLGEFLTDTKLFDLDINGMVQIDFYVWLEGQDVDCVNSMQEVQIFSNIQFFADFASSGLEEIPGRRQR